MRVSVGVLVSVGVVSLACGSMSEPPPSAVTGGDVERPAPTPVERPVEPSVEEPAVEAPPAVAPATLHVVSFWEGEWPTPVVHVTAATTVPARTVEWAESPNTTCALSPGVYHPWTPEVHRPTDGDTLFSTVNGVDRHRALVDMEFEMDGSSKVEISTGDIVTISGYLGEGYCSLSTANGVEFPEMCPGMEEGQWEDLPDPEVVSVQLFRPACNAWVETNEALFAHDGIQEGDFLGYGEAGPSGGGFKQ